MRLIKNSLCPHLLSLSSLTSTSLLHMVAWSWACCVSSSSWSHRRAFWCSTISCAPWSPTRSFSIASTCAWCVCTCTVCVCSTCALCGKSVCVCDVRGMCALVCSVQRSNPSMWSRKQFVTQLGNLWVLLQICHNWQPLLEPGKSGY